MYVAFKLMCKLIYQTSRTRISKAFKSATKISKEKFSGQLDIALFLFNNDLNVKSIATD